MLCSLVLPKVIQWRLQEHPISTIYIDHDCPWHVSFMYCLRVDCLERELRYTLTESRVVLEQWRQNYNHEHPHSRLGFKSPLEFLSFLSAPGRVRATPSLRQVLFYTTSLKPLTPRNSLT